MRAVASASRLVVCVLVALAASAHAVAADALKLKGIWQQGEVIFGQVPAGTRIEFKHRPVLVSPDGHFIVGLDRDEASPVELTVQPPDGAPQQHRYDVKPRKYDIQRLNGLPPGQVNAPPELSERIEREGALVREARMVESPRMDFLEAFQWPAMGRISGVYGSQRILNGEKKQPHYGVDVAIPTGTPVHAPAGGVVTLAEPDLYYTGGTLMIDHGHGLVSAFLHLSQVRLKVGDVVKQGDVIALSGASGRATGPHLDWRISWLEARIDAQRLVPSMPESKAAKPPSAHPKKTR